MAVRRFDGVDDLIRTAIGACNITGAVTIVALVRLPDAGLRDTVLALHAPSGSGDGYDLFIDSDGDLVLWNGSQEGGSASVDVVAGEGWLLIAANKASGTAAVRTHKYSFTKEEWTRANGNSIGNGLSVAGGWVQFGMYESAIEPGKFDAAAMAIFGSSLTDAQLNALVAAADLKGGWKAAGPAGLWTFDQASVEEAVSDLTGSGANQTAITGTTVLAEDPPIPYSSPPDVTTGAATGITPVKATLNGTVNPNGLPTTYYFEYGETEAYGTKVPASEDGDAGEGSEAVAVDEVIEGLHPYTTYHFRLVAVNAEGESVGEDAEFTTEKPIRVAVAREFPPDTLAVRIADPQTGASIARWAEDEYKAQNILSGITKGGEMPGGHKESGGALPRDPRVDWPDTDTYLDYYLEGAGGEVVWSGRLNQAPESDGDRMVVEPKAVGHQAALDDRLGLRLGFIDGDLSKWGEPSTQRRLDLLNAAVRLMASTSVGFSSKDPEAVAAAVIDDFTNVTTVAGATEAGEAHYDSGGLDIGAVFYHLRELSSSGTNTQWDNTMALGTTDTFATAIVGPDHNASESAAGASVSTPDPGYRFARLRDQFNVASEGADLSRVFAWQNIKVLSLLATGGGLTLQGTWPAVGYTVKQMLELAVPLYSYLEAREEDLEDGGYVVTQAWYSDPGPLSEVVKDLTKFELLDWFVMHGKRFELRFPGTYGRNWQANAGTSELKETAEDGERAWDRLIVRYQDVDGRTYTVGWPGSGADLESEQLLITDPDHPAVKAGYVREDILDLKGISTPERALNAGERWLQEANELSHAGTATLRGYVQDDKAVFRPVSQVQPGDWVRFNDAGSSGTGYRKIVAVNYEHDARSASVTLDAPPAAVAALLERFNAALQPLGLA